MTGHSEPLAIEFANTFYAVHGKLREGLDAPAQLAAWLEGHGTTPAEVGDPELTTFVALRDAIRGLIHAVVERAAPDPAQVALLNEAAATAPTWPALSVGAETMAVVERSHGPALPAALGAIARDAVRLLGGAPARNLRACQAPGCVQYFVKDHPRREWCSQSCGNRARVARHYLRRKEQ